MGSSAVSKVVIKNTASTVTCPSVKRLQEAWLMDPQRNLEICITDIELQMYTLKRNVPYHMLVCLSRKHDDREESPNKCSNLVTYDPTTSYKNLQSVWMRTNSWVSNHVTQQPCSCERNTRTKLLKAGGQEKNFKSFRGVKESLWRKELRSSLTSGLLDHPWLQGYSEKSQETAKNIC